MKAWVIRRTGQPLDVLTLEDCPEPPIADDELLVEVEAAGVMFPDLLLVRGEYQTLLTLPSVNPGAEPVGRVKAAGAKARTSPGTRVMATVSTAYGSFA